MTKLNSTVEALIRDVVLDNNPKANLLNIPLGCIAPHSPKPNKEEKAKIIADDIFNSFNPSETPEIMQLIGDNLVHLLSQRYYEVLENASQYTIAKDNIDKLRWALS